MAIEEDLEILSRKVTQLKLAYDQYFLGSRPREPNLLRDEVKKAVTLYSNQAIKNTAMRFKFNSICSRYQAFKRQWVDTLRKIEQGSYERHQFKAQIHGIEQTPAPAGNAASAAAANPSRDEIYSAYLEARRACGQSVKNLTAARLDALLDKQEAQLREQYGGSQVRFKVSVEDGKAKLKASRL